VARAEELVILKATGAAVSCTGNKQKSYKIIRKNTFTVQDKAKPDTENIRGLNLAEVKPTTVQVTRVPL
jgi:hypothetical protein